MNMIVERAADWLLPPRISRGAFQLVRTFRGILRTDPEVRRSVGRNRELRNLWQGERAFVLCTGPSIQQEELLPLAREHCIAVSMFSLHPAYREIAPEFHVLAPNHAPLGEAGADKMLRAYKNAETSRTTMLLGHMDYEHSYLAHMRRNPELRPARLRFLNFDGARHLDELNWNRPALWELSGRPFLLRSVLYGALQLALYMGCDRIYILGADQNYLESFYAPSEHFYREEEGVSDRLIHQNISPLELLDDIYYSWQGYELIRRYAEKKNQRIVNCSGGMLPIFPRARLKNIL